MLTTRDKILFRDRKHAAQLLSERLVGYKDTNAIVVAVPRGGAPVGYHLAKILNLDFEIIPCKKIKHPVNMIDSIGSVSIDDVIVHTGCRNIPQDYVYHQIVQLQHILNAKHKFYRGGKKSVALKGRTVILVDDVLESMNTVLACLKTIRKQNPSEIVLAVPTAKHIAIQDVKDHVDNVVCLLTHTGYDCSGAYKDLPEVTDEEVKNLFSKARKNTNGLNEQELLVHH